ncbi:MAG TPA: thiolase family protein, partial [Candidatus Binataceae bacterium]
GMCNAVLCLTADLNRMGRRRPPMISLMYEFEAPYGAIGANCSYALIAQRHMALFGTKPEQMAKVAVDQRRNAMANPLAFFNDTPLTIDDVLNSRYICEPLHLFEIVSPMSGGAAVIVASPEMARRSRHPPIWLIGAGEGSDRCAVSYAPDINESAVKGAAETAFKMAGVDRKDIDLVCPYDCYTITVLVTL